jgi:hypothetical protein
MNTILYIGLTLLLVGFVLFIVAVMMESYYDRELWKLHNGGDKHERNK